MKKQLKKNKMRNYFVQKEIWRDKMAKKYTFEVKVKNTKI